MPGVRGMKERCIQGKKKAFTHSVLADRVKGIAKGLKSRSFPYSIKY